MSRIDEMPDYRAQLGSTSHDLSHTFGFTATCAHLLPVYHDLVQPGERIRLGFNFNLRTQPLQSAAMEEIDVYTEYFFVPMPLLYEPFGSTYFNIIDNYSSNYPNNVGSRLGNNFPVLDFAALASDVYEQRKFKPYSQDGVTIGESIGQMYYRLFDMLGYNPTLSAEEGANFNPNTFPYPILAYNCIYQYYYRLDNRELFNQHTFNWDKFYNTPLVDYSDLTVRLYYRPLANDYFSDIKVSPIVDVLNLNVKDSYEQANQWLTRSEYITGNSVLGSGSPSVPVGTNTPDNIVQSNFGFNAVRATSTSIYANGMDINTANIRAMFATEKLWSVTGRAKKHYDDQTLAHFGFKVPHDPKHEISVFGKDHSVIHIGEVISTAATTDAPLGEIAGKGYGSQQSKRHDFTAPCHGVVMVIFSIVPRMRYQNTYLKVNALTSRLDLPIPEYDHLGMQPVFRYETNIDATNAQERSDVMGWQYRYEQYKRRFNRVTRVFQSGGTLSSWMLHSNANRMQLPNGANKNQYLSFVYWPTDLGSIMLVPYESGWSDAFDENNALIYDRDPFVIDSYIYSKKISWMSDYSLPRLDA